MRAATKHFLIETHDDILEGVRSLTRRCVVMRTLVRRSGPPPLRRHTAGFEGLARIVVGQQLSIASAGAIWRRLETATGGVTARMIARADIDALRAAGLSAGKVRTLKAIASRVNDGELDLGALSRAGDVEVHEALVALPGVGPWTADIFVMFCLGRADAWAAGDLALQVGVARACGLGERLHPDALVEVAERWRPWRAVAARIIWHDYSNLRTQPPQTASRQIASKRNGKRRPG